MADYEIDVVIDPRDAIAGGRRVETALNGIENAAERVQSLLNRALAFTGVSFGVNSLIQIADEFTNYQNRIRSVTKSTAEFNVVSEELFQISQRTRSAMDANAVLYQRTADAIKRQGFSLKETFQFIEAYNQAMKLGGAATQEADDATVQFSQGLGAGALRGEELNSVLEQSAVIADVIAAQFGVSRGELKSLGEQGKLTAEQIVKGFLNAREELATRFAAVIPTISQGFQVFRNSMVRIIGTYDQGAGASRLFAESLIVLADNLDNVIRIFAAAVMTIGTLFAVQAIPKAISAVNALTVAIAANPIGALLVALAAVISLLTVFSDKISVTEDGMVSLRDLGVAVWEGIKAAFASFIDFFSAHFAPLAQIARDVFGDINLSVEDTLRFTAKAVDMFLGLWKAAFNVIKVLFQQIPLIIQKAFADGINAAASGVESVINSMISKINSLRGSLGMDALGFLDFERVGLDFKAPAEDLGKTIGQAASEGFNVTFAQDALESGLQRAREVAEERRKLAMAQEGGVDMDKKSAASTTALDGAKKKLRVTFDQLYAALVREGEALKLNNREREIAVEINRMEERLKRSLTEGERQLAEAQLRLNQQLQIQADILDQIQGPVQEYKDTLGAVKALLDQGRISLAEYNNQLAQTQLGQGLSELRIALSPDEFAGQISELQTQLADRQLLLQQAREAELIGEQEFQSLSLEAHRQYNQALIDIENQRFSMQLKIGQSGFGQMAQLAKAFAGEQSSVYKGLFAASKAFALADASVQVANAIAKAANSGPFPYNLGAIASVTAATANLISTITSTNLNIPTFQNGGSFRVGGSGGTDSQLVQFRASPNETVSVRTPGQQKQEESGSGQGSPQPIVVQPINVFDPSIVGDFLESPMGDKVFINMIERNVTGINGLLRSN